MGLHTLYCSYLLRVVQGISCARLFLYPVFFPLNLVGCLGPFELAQSVPEPMSGSWGGTLSPSFLPSLGGNLSHAKTSEKTM